MKNKYATPDAVANAPTGTIVVVPGKCVGVLQGQLSDEEAAALYLDVPVAKTSNRVVLVTNDDDDLFTLPPRNQ